MSVHLNGVMDQALSLSQKDRVILLNHIWTSLDHAHRLQPEEIETVMTAYQRDREIELGLTKSHSIENTMEELDKVINARINPQ